MEAHGAAQELRDAAEDEAQRFFEAMGAAPGTGATCRENWAEDQHVTSYAVFEDLEETIQQVHLGLMPACQEKWPASVVPWACAHVPALGQR
jgi:hypothetical protein